MLTITIRVNARYTRMWVQFWIGFIKVFPATYPFIAILYNRGFFHTVSKRLLRIEH